MTPEEEFFRKAQGERLPDAPKFYGQKEGIFSRIWGSLSSAFGSIFQALADASSAPRCGVCSNLLKRTRYTWTLNGKSETVCSHCNTRLEREQSKRAFKK